MKAINLFKTLKLKNSFITEMEGTEECDSFLEFYTLDQSVPDESMLNSGDNIFKISSLLNCLDEIHSVSRKIIIDKVIHYFISGDALREWLLENTDSTAAAEINSAWIAYVNNYNRNNSPQADNQADNNLTSTGTEYDLFAENSPFLYSDHLSQ